MLNFSIFKQKEILSSTIEYCHQRPLLYSFYIFYRIAYLMGLYTGGLIFGGGGGLYSEVYGILCSSSGFVSMCQGLSNISYKVK